MKTKIIIMFFFISFFFDVFAQSKVTEIQPEFYYSNGNFSTSTTSNGFYGFANVIINDFDLVRIGLNKIIFDNPEWKYNQTNYSIGGVKNLYPFYIKTSFLYMNGEFDYKPLFSIYSDNLYTVALEIDYNVNLFYIGINFAYTNFNSGSDSLVSLNSKQFGLALTYEPSSSFLISITPTYTTLSDRGSLFSTEVLLKYSPAENLTAYLSGFWGERAYFYNHHLYTIYNQNSTQTSAVNFVAELKTSDKVTLVAGYTYTEFEDYLINYYTLGLKFALKQ